MTNKRIYIITGIVFLFFSLIGLRHDIESYKTQLTGDLITVTITYVPNCFGTKVPHHLRFEYQDNGQIKEYSKQIRNNCDDFYVGQKIRMKADLDKKIFLYEKGDMRIGFYAAGLMFIFGLIMIILGIKKSTAHNKRS
ncbi:hypothetical protein ACE01N_20040 [Saccharicrinis sp. FJH2]|uniref:hypothetical protein n=1 Tax=Saccharicrinis sp. FJH65 TaxID=3344659 RepID=UPI0035F4D0AB